MGHIKMGLIIIYGAHQDGVNYNMGQIKMGLIIMGHIKMDSKIVEHPPKR